MAPENTLQSSIDLRLSRWNPDNFRFFCQVHCLPPSLLGETIHLQKLYMIMSNISAKQRAKRNRLILLVKHVTLDSSKKVSLCYLRNGYVVSSQVNEGLSKCPTSKRSINSTEMEPPMKRFRRTHTTCKPC